MKNLKGWRTIGFNLLLVVAPVALTYLASINWADYLNPTWAAAAVGVFGLALRLVTTGPVGKAIIVLFAVGLALAMAPKAAMAANTLPLPKPKLAAAATPSATTVAANILSTAPADLNYAILLATQINTPASNVRKQCYQAILAAIPTAPAGSTPPPGPEVVTHIEQAAELADTLNPSSPVFVNCAGAATLVGQNVLSFINAIVTGVAGISILAPKL